MKKEELVNLRRLLNQELDRRNRSNCLLYAYSVKKFLELNGLKIDEWQVDDRWLIIQDFLKTFKITETNGIFVCIGNYRAAWNVDFHVTEFYDEPLSFHDDRGEYLLFKDIESEDVLTGFSNDWINYLYDNRMSSEKDLSYDEFFKKRFPNKLLASTLIQSHITLNPCNNSINNNGYNKVRKLFFETAIDEGQSAAKKLILSKYPIISKYPIMR